MLWGALGHVGEREDLVPAKQYIFEKILETF
jgi:hypothetical protein